MASDELGPYEFESMADIIFRADVDLLNFRQLAAASASCAVVGKYLDQRRKRIAARLDTKLANRETEGVKTTRSDSGKSLKAELDHIKLRRTEKGGGKSYDVEALRELLEEKEIEVERVIKPSREKIDEDALETFMVKHDIPREEIYKPVDPRPDGAILEALVSTGYLSEEELESVTTVKEPRVTVTCTFDRDTKEHFMMTLEAKEGSSDEGSDG